MPGTNQHTQRMANFNDRRSSASDAKILTSLWDGINPKLIARFYPVTKMPDGSGWAQSHGQQTISDNYVVDDDVEVHCLISDGTSESQFNWQSPFENAGAESKAPVLSAMLQSGVANSALLALMSGGLLDGAAQSLAEKSSNTLREISGRTGITRLNSTQVYSGSPPVKMSMTLHFRALRDPIAEVRSPVSQLEEWAHPQFLADDGFIANAIKGGTRQSLINTIFPSKVPQILGMQYGDGTYMPVVIESISKPLTNPLSSDGVMLACSVQITLATLTSLDRRDIQKLYS